MPFQLSKINHDDSDTFFFFIYFFIYLFKQITLLEQKLGQMIGLYMDLHHYNFGGATSRGLGQMHP